MTAPLRERWFSSREPRVRRKSGGRRENRSRPSPKRSSNTVETRKGARRRESRREEKRPSTGRRRGSCSPSSRRRRLVHCPTPCYTALVYLFVYITSHTAREAITWLQPSPRKPPVGGRTATRTRRLACPPPVSVSGSGLGPRPGRVWGQKALIALLRFPLCISGPVRHRTGGRPSRVSYVAHSIRRKKERRKEKKKNDSSAPGEGERRPLPRTCGGEWERERERKQGRK
ncbi:hypothetical protein LY76DRAFT_283535 [Colletotrichum caudatum]|nr:hypothetical protein LY76DRAFT_283535 [Colletotrichum caudatum]